MYWFMMFIYIIMNSLGLYLLKSGFNSFNNFSFSFDFIINLFKNLKFFFGLITYIISFLMWLILISKTELSYAIPIMIGLLYVSTAIVAFIFLKETVNLYKIIGIILIGIGVVLIISKGS